MTSRRRRSVVIVGGGAAGTLVAVRLLRRTEPVDVVVVERARQLGSGVAFGTDDPSHTLNVRCGAMSAYPDEPAHFAGWAMARGLAQSANDFVPRRAFGDYLRHELHRAASESAGSLRCVCEVAVAIEPEERPVVVTERHRLAADHVVLATGNQPPRDPASLAEAGDRYVADPWAVGWLATIGRDDPVLLVGTGLTAVDVCLTLQRRGHRGSIHAVSRHGRLPMAHLEEAGAAARPCIEPGDLAGRSARGLLRAVRHALEQAADRGEGWRPVVDGLRPVSEQLWRGLPTEEQQRFVRQLARRWELLRHRMAPQAADVIDQLQATGQLRLYSGGVTTVRRLADGVAVEVGRGPIARVLEVAALVNCTGPNLDVADDPLLRRLVADGLAVPDPLGLGLVVTADGAVVGTDGVERPWLWAVGGLRKGSVWESTAVPELRAQAAGLARSITEPPSVGVTTKASPSKVA